MAMLRMLVFRPESGVLQPSLQSATVRYVIDGDTVDLEDGRRVRLLGIDAPEVGYNDKPAETWAEEATLWLRDRLEGRNVQLRVDEKMKDRYGRTLAWIFDEQNVLINRELLAEGHAKLLPDYGLPADLELTLREAESEARVQRLGVWATAQKPRQRSRTSGN
jgi:micrococcal nuclease